MSKPTIAQQSEFIGDRVPLSWVFYLCAQSTDPDHTIQNLYRFQTANPGLHPEYSAYLWIESLYLKSQYQRLVGGVDDVTIATLASTSNSTSLSNWIDMTLQQQALEFDFGIEPTQPPRSVVDRAIHYATAILGTAIVIGCGCLAANGIITAKPDANHIQPSIQKPQ